MKKSLFLKFVLVILMMIISLYIIHRYMEYSKLPKESPPTRKDEPDKIKLKNNEWIKSLNILENSNIWFVDYYGSLDFTKDNYNSEPIDVSIRCNLEYMNEVVERDTQFIKDNPSYFKKDHKRRISCRNVSYVFKDEYYGYKNYTYTKDENLDFTKDGALRVWFTNRIYEIGRNEVCDNVEIVEVVDVEKEDLANELLHFDKYKIKNLKYIILHKAQKGLDTSDYKSVLQQIYPDVKIIDVEP